MFRLISVTLGVVCWEAKLSVHRSKNCNGRIGSGKIGMNIRHVVAFDYLTSTIVGAHPMDGFSAWPLGYDSLSYWIGRCWSAKVGSCWADKNWKLVCRGGSATRNWWQLTQMGCRLPRDIQGWWPVSIGIEQQGLEIERERGIGGKEWAYLPELGM